MIYYLTIYYIYGPKTYLITDYEIILGCIIGSKEDGKAISIQYYDADINGVLITNNYGAILFAYNKGRN